VEAAAQLDPISRCCAQPVLFRNCAVCVEIINFHQSDSRRPVLTAYDGGIATRVKGQASAADALDIWAGYADLITIESVSSSTVPQISDDAVNAVFFSNTIFGDDFGDQTLAVTVYLTDSGVNMIEADVLVNNAYRFDSYRGPLQSSAADFHRIIVHEFGHVPGLDHVTPYPPGQAIMEPIISDFDHLGADDVAGVRKLYGADITNLPEPVFLREDNALSERQRDEAEKRKEETEAPGGTRNFQERDFIDWRKKNNWFLIGRRRTIRPYQSLSLQEILPRKKSEFIGKRSRRLDVETFCHQ